MRRIASENVIIPTSREDDAINASAEADPDTYILTDEELSKMRPAKDVLPAFVRAMTRGPQKTPKKIKTTMRIDADVLDAFKKHGKGWQTNINEALRKVAGL